MNFSKICLLVSVISVCGVMTLSLPAAEKKSDAAATSQAKQKEFATPKEAADALVQAAESFDVAALGEILGPDSKDLISSEDPVADKEIATRFAAKAQEKRDLGADKNDSKRVIMTVGTDGFELPIPIVNTKGQWIFDTQVGREEMWNRRIATNDFAAISS